MTLTGFAPSAAAQDVRPQLWHLDAMQLEKVWKTSTGEGVKIAVVDSGVNSSTDALRGRVLPGKDVSGGPGDETVDDVGHGTGMAEIAAGTGRDGSVKGVAPDAEIIPIRTALGGSKTVKSGKQELSDAIRAAADSDAKIINMSFGGDYYHPDDEAAVKYAAKKGKLLFASVGNDAKKGNKNKYPAFYRDVVGVGATDRNGKVADFSEYGEFVDLVAPGTDLPRYCEGSFERYCEGGEGTSPASAIASASAALIWSKHPDWTANQVLRVMIDTAGRVSKNKTASKYIGHGAVRPRMNLLEGKGEPGDPDVSPLTGEKTGPAKSPSSAASSGPGKESAADKVEVADSSGSDDNSPVLTILGAGFATVVLGGGAFAIWRVRRG